MKFSPINGHVQVAPIKEGGVVQRGQTKFEEKGTVIDFDAQLVADDSFPILVGDIVYFDAWLCAKYGEEDTEDERWLVKYEDIRAVERA